MNIRKNSALLFSTACMFVLILDTHTAIQGAAEGIDICIRSLIPSLFPFFIFSTLLTSSLTGQPIPFLRPLANLCRIPKGAESLLLIGFLGGYPVGAQNVAFAWRKGYLRTNEARRIVAFCSNAGPAFIFGILGQMFYHPLMPWVLWFIHISSALIVGFLLPGQKTHTTQIQNRQSLSLPDALNSSVVVMARVCGWVVLFRILLEFLQKWFFWLLSPALQVIVTGLLELSNGCLMLPSLASDSLRLIWSAVFLGFGGFCVLLQTRSIAQGLPLSLYLPGKLLQSMISFLLSYGAQFLLLPDDHVHFSPYILTIVILATLLLVTILRNIEKPVAISKDLLYNEESCEKRRA